MPQATEPGQTRATLALALTMLEREQIIDFNGHFSARCPADLEDADIPQGAARAGAMFINAGDSVRSQITPEDFICIDFDGRPLHGDRLPPMEFHLHAQIYKARPDVMAVVHTHPRWSTVLSTAGHEWLPVTMQAAVLCHERPIATFPKTASISSAELGAELAAFLGAGKAALLHRHGAVSVAPSIEVAFVQSVYLEDNAERQHQALQIGTPQALTADECASIGRNLSRPALLQKVWNYHVGKHVPLALSGRKDSA